MDPKYKTPLAVVVGIVIGVTLLGSAIAIPVMFRAAHSVVAGAQFSPGPGMMNDGWDAYDRGPGLMGRQAPRDGFGPGACPQGDSWDADDRGPGMMGRQRFPQNQAPCGGDPADCPRVSDDASPGV